MEAQKIVPHGEWVAARKRLLAREKEMSKARDALNAERRALPMELVEKDYLFDGPNGKTSLADLFEGRRQLLIYHFMFDPEWENGCHGCTSFANSLPDLSELHKRETTLAMVSRAPFEKLSGYKQKMGWTVPWYSSFGSDFNYDFHVTLDEKIAPIEINYRGKAEFEAAKGAWDQWGTELPGLSVFLRDEDRILHSYSTYARGLEPLVPVLHYLDLAPLGRQGS
ncbi:DUF899 domain-containing protein [Mesorhizobium sp. CGMCC 1.15528]|uniref:DUF899 domain-containing protein n=1 Tax=Mesorhizobium zhangyense TaxID=1776730 RepID=A0A7C9R6F0_9HYPH|nr:DUF899 domain-containing protein [Mesorhizobium zhangyense]NGN39553.1 DUF899 domain-containing protein [Mesorhizobium zhangyense]